MSLSIPNKPQNEKLVSAMFPFSFSSTYEAIKATCEKLGLDCLKGDNIWVNSTFIQDIFEIIYTSKVVIADFAGKNPNVFYEVGIEVVQISWTQLGRGLDLGFEMVGGYIA